MILLHALALLAIGGGQSAKSGSTEPVEVEFSSMLIPRDGAAWPDPLPEAQWERVPRPADFRGIDRAKLVSTGQVEANCELGGDRRLRRCIYTGSSPNSPPMMALYKRAVNGFQADPATPFLREGQIERVVVNLIVKVPGAREAGVQRCLPPRCNIIPPPPSPPPHVK